MMCCNVIRRVIFSLLTILSATTFAQAPTEVTLLESGKPLERTLAVGQSHNYSINLPAGQFARLAVEQRGINVVLNVFAPDGSRLFFVDRQGQGTKEVVLVAVTTGAFRLWIGVQAPPQSQNIAPGKYEVRIAELRSATAADQLRYDATKAYSELIAQGQRKEAEALGCCSSSQVQAVQVSGL